MKNPIFKFSTLLFSLLLLLTSCQKETIENPDGTPISAVEMSSETALLMDAVEDEAMYRTSPATPIRDCPRITWSAPMGTYPNSVVLDYGTGSGCIGMDGRRYSGQIKIHMTASYYDKSSIRTIRTGNLVVDDVQVELNRQVINMGFDKNNQMYWKVESSGSQNWAVEPSKEVWSSDRVRTLVSGHDTADDLTDDSFAITGQSKGITREGRALSSHITVPLIKRNGCRWLVSGMENFALEGQDGEWKVDFGDGVCDNKALVTEPSGQVVGIVLDGFWR